jgi:hypothetical protein
MQVPAAVSTTLLAHFFEVASTTQPPRCISAGYIFFPKHGGQAGSTAIWGFHQVHGILRPPQFAVVVSNQPVVPCL